LRIRAGASLADVAVAVGDALRRAGIPLPSLCNRSLNGCQHGRHDRVTWIEIAIGMVSWVSVAMSMRFDETQNRSSD